MKRNILLITYHYPPSMAVGGLRAANFARYLPNSDWHPQVLTIEDRYLDQSDPQRLSGLDHAPIHKTRKLPTLSDAYLAIKKRLRRGASASVADEDTVTESTASRLDADQETMTHRLKRYIFSLAVNLPDVERDWIIPAVLKGLALIKKERIDCILTSCPPYSVHLIGLILKRMTGVPWVADFRDPWITGSQKRLYYNSQLSMAIERGLERQVLRRADLVIGNTAILTDRMKEAHPDLSEDKFINLPNGFNPEQFAQYQNLEKDPHFTITYTGSLYFGRSPEPLFQGLQSLITDGKIDPDQIRVKLVGHCAEIEGRSTESVAQHYHLSDVVDIIPPVPYGQAMEIVGRSHMALLLAPDQPLQIPAKVYDYLGTGTPIIALAGEGATADIIRQTGAGAVFAPDDITGICDHLIEMTQRPNPLDQSENRLSLGHLDIRHIVSVLADRLQEVSEPYPGKGNDVYGERQA